MITYRLKGLIQLHIFVTAGLAAGFFLIFAAVTRYLPWVHILPNVNLVLCVLAIVVGMLMSGRFLMAISGRFHLLGWPDAAWLATRQIAFVALVLFTLIVATKDRSISRIFLAHYLVLGWGLLVCTNRILPRFLAQLAFDRQHRLPTIFIGSRKTLDRLDPWIAKKLHLGVQPVGFLSDDEHDDVPRAVGPMLGSIAGLGGTIERLHAAQVILLDLPADKAEIIGILETCQAAGCRLLIYDNVAARLPIPMIPVSEDGYYFFTAQQEPLEDPFNRSIKRGYDIVIAAVVVAFVLPPVTMAVWLMQTLQAPGPIFFIRSRGGLQRSEFQMLKFRSMYFEAPDHAREAMQARSDDGRVFPFGRFIRRTSIDELPQFWNVLMGEMSIVGPRPHLPSHDFEFSKVAKAYRTRHLVKPGITGLAQIQGFRGEITDPALLEQRVQQDIAYISNWSIWLDVQITARTLVLVIFPQETAY